MFEDCIIRYEVIAWVDAENPQRPCYMQTFRSKALAVKQARSVSRRYPLVEVNENKINANDPNDLREGKLLASWTHGRKTA